MNANNATDPYASPPATPVRPTPPELKRKKRKRKVGAVRTKVKVDSNGHYEILKFYESSDTDAPDAEPAPAAESSPAAKPSPAAGADDA